jgi:hypothetical protein
MTRQAHETTLQAKLKIHGPVAGKKLQQPAHPVCCGAVFPFGIFPFPGFFSAPGAGV